MDLREMVLKIYEELRRGDGTSLGKLLEENELIFDRFLTEFFSQTPLHIAIQHRSVDFAREILRRKPLLAHVLSSQGFSPLRMASANGSDDIVRELLLLIVDVSHDRDSKGWTPVHAAAMKGHVHVLEEFKRTNPEWIRDITDRDETVLHLYVKYNDNLDALKTLIGLVGPGNQLVNREDENENTILRLPAMEDSPDNEFVNRKDENGNTILHLAAMKKDTKMIRYLISAETVVEINAANMNGFTALDVFTVYPGDLDDIEMVKELLGKGAVRSREMFTEKAEQKLKNILMLVGTLTATLCFQAALVPPGGLWQDDSNMGNNTLDQKNHTAGTSILADKEPNMFRQFQIFNHLVFILSLVLILLAAGTVGPISDVVDIPPFLRRTPFLRRISDVVKIPPFLRRISDVVKIEISEAVNMLSFLRFQQYLPVVLSFVSVMIYRCNKMITYLISPETGLEINAMNMNGFTVMDVFALYPSNPADTNMLKKLRQKGAERSRENPTEKATSELRKVLMLVGILTATLCFQAALVPPGGLWQDDSNMGNNTLDKTNHTAGTSILADKDHNQFRQFQLFNHLAFYLSTILILAGGTVGLGHTFAVVNMLLFLPLQLYLPLVVGFLSVMIYRCNEVHTPKGLPHDIRSNLNESNRRLLVSSLIICLCFFIYNLIGLIGFPYLKRRLQAAARNRGSNADTGNQQHS